MTEKKMTRWSQARLAYYVGMILAGLGVLASALGYAEFDPGTGEIDFLPFNVYALAAIIAGPLFGLVMAAADVVRGWGR